MATLKEKRRMLNDYPNIKNSYLKVISDIKKSRDVKTGIWEELTNDEIFEWWIKKKTKGQILAERDQTKLNI